MRSNVRVVFYETKEGHILSYCKGVYAYHKDITQPMTLDNSWVSNVPFSNTLEIRQRSLESLTPYEREQHFAFWGVIPIDVDPASMTKRKVVAAVYQEIDEAELKKREQEADYYMNCLHARENRLPPPEKPQVVKDKEAQFTFVFNEEPIQENITQPQSVETSDNSEGEDFIMTIESFKNNIAVVSDAAQALVNSLKLLSESVTTVSIDDVKTAPAPVATEVVTSVASVAQEIEAVEPAVLPVVPAAFIPTVFTSTAPRKAVADVAFNLQDFLYQLFVFNTEHGVLETYSTVIPGANISLSVALNGLDSLYQAITSSTQPTAKAQQDAFNGYLRNLSNSVTYQLTTLKRAGFLNGETLPFTDPLLVAAYPGVAHHAKTLIQLVLDMLVEWRKNPLMGQADA